MHTAHKADVIRMEALLTYGGIYLDFDVLVVRAVPPNRIIVRAFASFIS